MQTEDRHQGKAPDASDHLERGRDRGDVVVIVVSALALFAVLAAATLAAWSFSTDGEQYATTAPQNVSLAY